MQIFVKLENAPRLGHGWRDHLTFLSIDIDQHRSFPIFPARTAQTNSKNLDPGFPDFRKHGERTPERTPFAGPGKGVLLGFLFGASQEDTFRGAGKGALVE